MNPVWESDHNNCFDQNRPKIVMSEIEMLKLENDRLKKRKRRT